MVRGRIHRSHKCDICTTKDDTVKLNRFDDETAILIERFNSVINNKIQESDTIDRVFVTVMNRAIGYKSNRSIFGDY